MTTNADSPIVFRVDKTASVVLQIVASLIFLFGIASLWRAPIPPNTHVIIIVGSAIWAFTIFAVRRICIILNGENFEVKTIFRTQHIQYGDVASVLIPSRTLGDTSDYRWVVRTHDKRTANIRVKLFNKHDLSLLAKILKKRCPSAEFDQVVSDVSENRWGTTNIKKAKSLAATIPLIVAAAFAPQIVRLIKSFFGFEP